MNTAAGINHYVPGAFSRTEGNGQSTDPKAMAKEVETIFLNEILKVLLEQTSIGKDKVVSTYLPLITTEIAGSLAERGTGVGEFVTKKPLSGSGGKGASPIKIII